MIKEKLNHVLIFRKYFYHLLLGKLFGISYIVSYMRNPDPKITVRLLRAFGAKIGDRTTIKRTIYLDNVYEDQNSSSDFSHLEIGNNCYIGDCSYFDLSNEIIIRDNVVISARVSFVTHADCNRSKHLEKLFPRTCKKIIVQDGVWIAIGATILNGVKIGKNSIIAAQSLVNGDVEEFCLYGGIPARRIRDLGIENF